MSQQFGKLLIVAGLFMAGLGLILLYGGRSRWLRLGRLPGDISYHRNGFSFFFPITTMILLSVLLTVILWLTRFIKR